MYDLYKIDSHIKKGKTWHDYWYIIEHFTKINDDYNISYYLKGCDFFQSIKKCIIFYIAIPSTTYTNEISFSTLCLVKTWQRFTMMEQRLSGLCMLRIYRQETKNFNLIKNVINAFLKINIIYNLFFYFFFLVLKFNLIYIYIHNISVYAYLYTLNTL